MLLICGVGEDSWESLGLQGDQASPSKRKSILNTLWKDWCWSWNSNNLTTWWEELTHWKRPWCWERLKAGWDRAYREWDGWMASLTWWTWIRASSGSWWWTGKPGMLQSMGSQRVGRDWDWTDIINHTSYFLKVCSYDKFDVHFQWNVFFFYLLIIVFTYISQYWFLTF